MLEHQALIFHSIILAVVVAAIFTYFNLGRWYLREAIRLETELTDYLFWRLTLFLFWPLWMLAYFIYDIYDVVINGEA